MNGRDAWEGCFERFVIITIMLDRILRANKIVNITIYIEFIVLLIADEVLSLFRSSFWALVLIEESMARHPEIKKLTAMALYKNIVSD